jgi:hypothetical protein
MEVHWLVMAMRLGVRGSHQASKYYSVTIVTIEA